MVHSGQEVKPISSAALPSRALQVHNTLCENFHPPFVHPNDRLGPLSQLVYAMVARGTLESVADQAFRRLCTGYWSWAEVRDERPWRIESLIADTAFADEKARHISEMLVQVSECSSWREPSLHHLTTLSDDEATAALETLTGVSPRISRSVLLFSTLRRSVLPLDNHGFRCAVRIGLVSNDADESTAHNAMRDQLPANWSAADCERHYFAMRGLGQNYCTPRRPRCGVCPVRAYCRFAS